MPEIDRPCTVLSMRLSSWNGTAPLRDITERSSVRWLLALMLLVGTACQSSQTDPAANETLALDAVRLMISAQFSYYQESGKRFACPVTCLAAPTEQGCIVGYRPEAPIFLDQKSAQALLTRNGYVRRFECESGGGWVYLVTPEHPQTGGKAFCTDGSGSIRFMADGSAPRIAPSPLECDSSAPLMDDAAGVSAGNTASSAVVRASDSRVVAPGGTDIVGFWRSNGEAKEVIHFTAGGQWSLYDCEAERLSASWERTATGVRLTAEGGSVDLHFSGNDLQHVEMGKFWKLRETEFNEAIGAIGCGVPTAMESETAALDAVRLMISAQFAYYHENGKRFACPVTCLAKRLSRVVLTVTVRRPRFS